MPRQQAFPVPCLIVASGRCRTCSRARRTRDQMQLPRCWILITSTALITIMQQRSCTALLIERSPRPTLRSRGGWELRCCSRSPLGDDGSSTTTPASTISRRRMVTAIVSFPISQWVVGYAVDPSVLPNRALAAVPAITNKATVVLKSPNDTLGLELVETTIGSPPQSVLAIARITSPKPSSAARHGCSPEWCAESTPCNR